MSTLKVDTLQTTGGAGLYPARAWANYNMLTLTLTGSGNISSLTDGGTGIGTLSFSNNLPAATYTITGSSYKETGISNVRDLCLDQADTQLTSASTLRMMSNSGVLRDMAFNLAAWTL